MTQSLSNRAIQIIFCSKNREPWLDHGTQAALFGNNLPRP